MLKKGHFDILNYLQKNQYINQRVIMDALGYSLGKINRLLSEVKENGWVDGQYSVTASGFETLEPYKVNNAIIMAAGMSSRFAPLSYEKPKGLLIVKGEVLIERQIRQLHEAGIKDITVVVGYMKELFFYLKDKFNVSLVINEDYMKYNNPYTLLKVLDRLSNTFVCSSDNYFVDNVFENYVYRAYYSSVNVEDATGEWTFVINSQDKIIDVEYDPVSGWIMRGHVYFDRLFSEAFKKILLANYTKPVVNSQVWEYLLSENLDKLPIYIRRYDAHRLLEFDSLEDLRHFDDKYLQNTGSQIFKNICSVFNCEEGDIRNINLIPHGFMNLSFKFTVNGTEYVYRHPGRNTERLVSRKAEFFAEQNAEKLGLDKTYICMSPDTGWKISKYIPDARFICSSNSDDLRTVLKMIKKLHDAKLKSPVDFNLWYRTEDEMHLLIANNHCSSEIEVLFSKMKKLNEFVEADHVEKVLNHGDFYSPNLLVDEKQEYYLIDWEYSGNADPMHDISEFVISVERSENEILQLLTEYFGRNPTENEIRHTYAYLALEGFYWYIWAINKGTDGTEVGEYTLIWYNYATKYVDKAIDLYK